MSTSPSTELQERDRRLAKQRMRATSNASSTDLHLPNLSIRGFRGIQDLTIAHLGRVTLFGGQNGVGKTTLLEAVRIYAARGSYSVLTDILRKREEVLDDEDEDGASILALNWEAFFYGRHISSAARIAIGPTNDNDQLHIDTTPLSQEESVRWERFVPAYIDRDVRMLRVRLQDKVQTTPMTSLRNLRERRLFWNDDSELPPEIQCESLGPSLLSNIDMARFWDKVALTVDEIRAVDALNLIFGDTVERVAVVGDARGSRFPYSRRVVVKIKGEDWPVSLKSLGDGAVRLFGVALALANSRGGFLLIDEAENGIHHSIQRAFWKMVLKTAHENDVQVFATTHSWDCVAGFAQAATKLEEVEGIYVRLDEDDDQVRAVEYSKKNLRVAAKQGIEVR